MSYPEKYRGPLYLFIYVYMNVVFNYSMIMYIRTGTKGFLMNHHHPHFFCFLQENIMFQAKNGSGTWYKKSLYSVLYFSKSPRY